MAVSSIAGPSQHILPVILSNFSPNFLPLIQFQFPPSLDPLRLMRCKWQLDAPEGHHIVLNITSFFTEQDMDFLFIFEGNDTKKEHKELWGGGRRG